MKKLIIGLTIGLMIGMSTNAFAAIGDTIQATFVKYNLIINGSTASTTVDQLDYEGTTYVPFRQIANLFGYNVTYLADSSTISFDKPTMEPTPAPTPSPTTAPIGTIGAMGQSTQLQGAEVTANPAPSSTPNPTPAPTASPPPKLDNTAVCQSIDNEYVMQIWNAEQRDLGKADALKYYYKQAKDNAGCS